MNYLIRHLLWKNKSEGPFSSYATDWRRDDNKTQIIIVVCCLRNNIE